MNKLTLLFILLLAPVPLLKAQTFDSVNYQITYYIKNLPPQTVEVHQYNKGVTKLGVFEIKTSPDTIVVRGKTPEECIINLVPKAHGAFILPVYNETATVIADYSQVQNIIDLFAYLQTEGSQRMEDYISMYHMTKQTGTMRRHYQKVLDDLIQSASVDSLITQAEKQLALVYDQRILFYQQLLRQTQSPSVGQRCLLHYESILKKVKRVNFNKSQLLSEYRYYIKKFPHHHLSDIYRTKLQQDVITYGEIAPNISLPDTAEQTRQLQDLRGQYVLLDFWASWCKPCRQESPHLRQAYAKYKAKGFTILSVSVDKKPQAWKKAIAKDQLNEWLHLNDAHGWQSPVLATYGIQQLPANLLLDPNGKIVAMNLRGKELINTLKKILK